jgi:hypothetical protein
MRTDSLHGKWEVHTPIDDCTIEVVYFTTKLGATQYYKENCKMVKGSYICKNANFN